MAVKTFFLKHLKISSRFYISFSVYKTKFGEYEFFGGE